MIDEQKFRDAVDHVATRGQKTIGVTFTINASGVEVSGRDGAGVEHLEVVHWNTLTGDGGENPLVAAVDKVTSEVNNKRSSKFDRARAVRQKHEDEGRV